MKLDDLVSELEAVAQKKGIRVAYEALAGEVGGGGLCKVKGEYRIIVDKRATPGERASLLAQSLAGFPLDDVFVAPEVRDLIERSA